MKLSKRILSAFLAVLTVLSLVTVIGAANVTFTDVSGHWAWTGGQIQYLVDKGVLNGYKQSNGTYKFVPDGEVTRAEFIKMLDETFGLTATAYINYSDVKTTDWHYPYFAKAAAQGYLLNYGYSVNPNGKITREEAISLLVRYLDLPANERADTSYFADYNFITENYRDYVLRGIYAGLTDGYNENGAKYFKPQKTLTRAEALTILYRAAGCIFNVNAYSRDSGAAPINNVITRGGVILNGVSLQGRAIISEGASSGTVSLSGCSVADTLYVRGTADVTLDNCKIKNIVITNGCKLSLLNGTEVENITVYGKSSLGVYSGITLGVLDIENGAAGTDIKGDGRIEMAYINASGVTASMVPTEFQIGNNITATFASSAYQGSSDAQDSFTTSPFITSDGSDYYLNLYPAVDGQVYYYFTNGANAPTTASFDSYYESSSFTGMVTVKAGKITTEETYSASSVKNFEYVVLQLQADGRKYAPVMIPNTNTDGNGFSTTPYLADASTIKFVAAQAGTIHWYYAESGEARTQTEFLEEYAKADKALKDSSTVVSGRTLNIGLSDKYLKNYDYVVLLLQGGVSAYYTPVVVSAGDDGFVSGPSLKSVGTIEFETDISGDLFYYYAENANLPAADDFKTEYNRADYSDNLNVTKNRASTFDYRTSLSSDYPYLIIALRNGDKEYMQPVAVSINYQTGFRDAPEVEDETNIAFRTENDGEVKYYYSKTDNLPSISAFHDIYADTSSRNKDTVDVSDSWERIQYSPATAKTYPYMILMFIDEDDTEYTPVCVKLDATTDNGFVIAPYMNNRTVFFKTEDEGEVWYFFSRSGESVKSSEFEEFYGDVSDRDLYGSVSTDGSRINYFTVDEDVSFSRYPYLVIAFLAETDDGTVKKFHYPVVLDIENSDLTGTGIEVDSVEEGEISFTTQIDGTLYYYYTDSYPSVDSDNFARRYDSAGSSNRDSRTAYDGKEFDLTYGTSKGYKYLVLCVRIEESSTSATYLAPVVIDLSDYTATSDGDLNATTGRTGVSIKASDIKPNEKTIKLKAEYDGTVYVYLLINGKQFGTQLDSREMAEGDTWTFDYSNYVGLAGAAEWFGSSGTLEIAFQLVNDDETYASATVEIN